jgi:hypothetical protein
MAFTRLSAADALPVLLQQAFALSFAVPEYNRQLLMHYAQLAASVPVFRLRFRRAFEIAGELYDGIDDHLATDVQTMGAPRAASRGLA